MLGQNIGLKELGNFTVGELLRRLEAVKPQDPEIIKTAEKVGVPQLSKHSGAEDFIEGSIDKLFRHSTFILTISTIYIR
jgi:hypothetical protein